jgi:DHA1 family bicyclomycin/chloramphenicol resistance-like MFS transporter
LTQSLGIYLIAFAVSTLVWGPLSDRFGRRGVIIGSQVLYMLASVGCALSDSMSVFLVFRALQGFSASGGFIAGRAMIRDAHDERDAHRAMSQVTLLFAIAPAVAPVLGGWLHDYFGWRSVFWFLGLFSVVLCLMTIKINETLPPEHRQSLRPGLVARVYLRTLQHRRFPLITLSLGATFGGMFLYIAGAPTVIYDFLGLGVDDFGYQFIPMVAGLMLGAALSGRLSHRWSPQRTVRLGFLVIVTGVLINVLQVSFLQTSVLTTIGPLVIYAFGVALVMPAITIMALDCFPHHRGTAASMQGFMQMTINAGVASLVVPALHSQQYLFVAGQVMFAGLAIALWFLSLRRYLSAGE